ncbi:MAG TPA: glycosyltransferase [Longimicrobiales bacterium]|nr:glycosyltransferase [Longimicrobiales bacterium]
MSTEPTRVFHLIKGLGRGGAEMLLAEGLRFADRDRFHYEYGYFLPHKDALVAELCAHGVDVTCFGGVRGAAIVAASHRLAGELRRRHVDVLHCHLPLAGIAGRLAGRLAGVPVVYTEHNKQERYHPLTRRLNRLTWPMQERAIAVSGDVADSIRRNIGTGVPVDVILNGVDVERFAPNGAGRALRKQLGIDQEALVIGTVAVFRTQKRLNHWVTAARRIHDRHPDSRFIVVGDGPLRADVMAAVESAGLQHVLHAPGLCSDVRPYLDAIDIYMMSSIFEGLPVALLEAMSMECVPVCTAVGGIPEVVVDRRNGLLVQPEEPAALADAVLAVAADPAARAAIGAAARSTVVERFSMRRMAGELETLYTAIASRHAHLPRPSRAVPA